MSYKGLGAEGYLTWRISLPNFTRTKLRSLTAGCPLMSELIHGCERGSEMNGEYIYRGKTQKKTRHQAAV